MRAEMTELLGTRPGQPYADEVTRRAFVEQRLRRLYLEAEAHDERQPEDGFSEPFDDVIDREEG